jgi:hypothetical protein
VVFKTQICALSIWLRNGLQRDGQYRSADDNRQGVGGDQVACLTFGDAKRGGYLGQDAGNGEFGHADGEGRKCEKPDLKWHFRLE